MLLTTTTPEHRPTQPCVSFPRSPDTRPPSRVRGTGVAQANTNENGGNGTRLTSAKRKELAGLRRKNRQLEMETEILNSAAEPQPPLHCGRAGPFVDH